MEIEHPIAPHILRQLIDYDPETGAMTWRQRDHRHSNTVQGYKFWNRRYAGKPAFHMLDTNGELRGCVFGKTYRTKRVAWALTHGRWSDFDIINLDGDLTNNRLVNLAEDRSRPIAGAVNLRRPQRRGATGVYFESWQGKFIALVQGRRLGSWPTRQQALDTFSNRA